MDQTNYTLPGIMHYLQSQYTIIEKNKILNDLEKSELKLKITKLESERNALLLENSKLAERVKQLELNQQKQQQNGDPINLRKLNDDDNDQLETIDTTNLVRARQFLKNTTNEILFLLNSPSIDNADPLELSKDEPEFAITRDDDNDDDPFRNGQDNNIFSPNRQNNHHPPVLEPPHRIHPPTIDTAVASDDHGEKKLFEQKQQGDDVETDTETITNGITDDEDEDVETTLFQLKDVLKTPIRYFKVDVENNLIYLYSNGENYALAIDLKSNTTQQLQLSPPPQQQQQSQDINSRVFTIDSHNSILISGSGTATQGFVSICSITGSEEEEEEEEEDGNHQVLTFDSCVKSLDCFSERDGNDDDDEVLSVLGVLLENGQVQIFEIDSLKNITPHQNSLMTELPPDTVVKAIKFSNRNEITLITTQGRILRYDFVNDGLIYNLNIGVNISEMSCFQISSNFFIHEFNSSTICVLDLLSQDLKTFVIENPFKITSISLVDEHFSLTYSNGTIELYDLASIVEVVNTTTNDDQRDYPSYNKNNRTLPNYIRKIDYYQNHTKPMIIKDVIVDLVDGYDEHVKIYAIGSDMNIKQYVI